MRGRVVVVGVGNVLKGDDGVGPCIVERLRARLYPRSLAETPVESAIVRCINAEGSLDRYVGPIAKCQPDTVLIIDAAHLMKPPGAFEILTPDELVDTEFSTHDISFKNLLDVLGRRVGGDVLVLGIQPESVELRIGLSPPVRSAAKRLERMILKAGQHALRRETTQPMLQPELRQPMLRRQREW